MVNATKQKGCHLSCINRWRQASKAIHFFTSWVTNFCWETEFDCNLVSLVISEDQSLTLPRRALLHSKMTMLALSPSLCAKCVLRTSDAVFVLNCWRDEDQASTAAINLPLKIHHEVFREQSFFRNQLGEGPIFAPCVPVHASYLSKAELRKCFHFGVNERKGKHKGWKRGMHSHSHFHHSPPHFYFRGDYHFLLA